MIRYIFLVLVIWLLALGIWALVHPDPDCKESITLRGVPFAIQMHHCTTEE